MLLDNRHHLVFCSEGDVPVQAVGLVCDRHLVREVLRQQLQEGERLRESGL